MAYNPNIHHRQSIRLKGYDYSQAGLYFITICAQDRACLFGKIVGAPLVGAQNNGVVQNMVARNDDTVQNDDAQNNGVVQNVVARNEDTVQNDDAQNNGVVQNMVARNDDTVQNDGVIQNETNIQNNDNVQNETDIGNDGGRTDYNGWPQIGSQIGRPQGHAPTDARNDATTHAPIMILNDSGTMVETEWLALKLRFPNIELHEYVIMPNHFHGILQIVDTSLMGKTVCDMMDAFKSITTVEYIRGVKQSGWKPFNRKLWQRDYWEHIIRYEQSYQNISDYIIDNPAKWKNDKFFNQ